MIFTGFLNLLNNDEKRKKLQFKTQAFVQDKYNSTQIIINEIFNCE